VPTYSGAYWQRAGIAVMLLRHDDDWPDTLTNLLRRSARKCAVRNRPTKEATQFRSSGWDRGRGRCDVLDDRSLGLIVQFAGNIMTLGSIVLSVGLRKNCSVATIVIFHSVLGLRPVEQEAADRFRSLGFNVALPDLYGGKHTTSIKEGFELMAQIGWTLICERALQAVTKLPDTTVLAGFSMGAGVIANLWRDRPKTKAVLLFHALAEIPNNVRPGLKLQLHMADTKLRSND